MFVLCVWRRQSWQDSSVEGRRGRMEELGDYSDYNTILLQPVEDGEARCEPKWSQNRPGLLCPWIE